MIKRTAAAALILCLLASTALAIRPAQAIVDKINANYQKIRDASVDLTLEYSLMLFGCSGLRRQQGKGWFKAPDRIKAVMEGVTYFARGNRIRKIDEKGKRFYVRLLHAVDFTPGFHAGLMPHNFRLRVLQDDQEGIIIQGIPKPGTLKNVTEVRFHIDPQRYTIEKLDLDLVDRNLSGQINVFHELIDGVWVPVGFEGTSALEIRDNLLIGLRLKLLAKNVRLNTGLAERIFDPGF